MPLASDSSITPFALVHGFYGSSPLKSVLAQLREVEPELAHEDWVKSVVSNSKMLADQYWEQEQLRRDAARLQYNKSVKDPGYQLGEIVLLRAPSRDADPGAYTKLGAQATGPYRIVALVGEDPAHAVNLQDAESGLVLLDQFTGRPDAITTERLIRFSYPSVALRHHDAAALHRLAVSLEDLAPGDWVVYFVPEAGVAAQSGTDFTVGRVVKLQGDHVVIARHRLGAGPGPWTRTPWRLEPAAIDEVSRKELLAGVDLDGDSILEPGSVEGLTALGLVERGARS